MKRQKKLLVLCRIAVIAAIYFVATYFLAPISFGEIQFRISEGMMILPLFFPDSIVGLTLGCVLANLSSPFGIIDVGLGSLATLIGGIGTFFLGKILNGKKMRPFISLIPPVVSNVLIVPLVWLLTGTDDSYWVLAASLFVSETISVYAIGLPLYYNIDRILQRSKPV